MRQAAALWGIALCHQYRPSREQDAAMKRGFEFWFDSTIEGPMGTKLVKYRQDKLFGFDVPLSCPDVPEDVLEPSNSWGDKDDYWKKYDALASRYIENFKKFADGCPAEVTAAGPKRLKK